METAPLDPALIGRFQEQGFVVVPDLLDHAEVEAFAPHVDAGVARRGANDTREFSQKSRYEQCFQQCINLWEDCPEVRPLTFHPRLARAAAELLGVAGVRLWHDQALYKEAGGRATDPHQDQPYWPIRETRTVSAWIPLAGSELENGAVGYVPGSHRFGVRRFVNIFGEEDPYDLLSGPEARGIEPVFAEVPQGSVAFHHGLTIHLSKPNKSEETRRVYTVIYFADGCTRDSDFWHFSVDRFGIEVGAAIASPATPVAWPRETGDLPDAPPDEALAFGIRRKRDEGGER